VRRLRERERPCDELRLREERPPRDRLDEERPRLELRVRFERPPRLEDDPRDELPRRPRPLAPPVRLLTVAQAMRPAVLLLRPCFFSESSMCSAMRFCLLL